jgi:hypothetical protein
VTGITLGIHTGATTIGPIRHTQTGPVCAGLATRTSVATFPTVAGITLGAHTGAITIGLA